MDETGRKITKIAREVNKLTVQTMKEDGIGTAEFDFIHLIRHNPGITQAGAAASDFPVDRRRDWHWQGHCVIRSRY